MSKSLCSTCQLIDFRKYLYESKFFSTAPLALLGSWEQICKRTQCPFCRLVHDGFSSHAQIPPSKSMIMLSNRKSWKCCISYNEYHGIRWKDYSNEFDLHAQAERTHAESRYQFVVYWERGPREFVEVFLRPLRDGPFYGRIVDQERANLSLCRKWLDLCHDYHNGASGVCLGKKTSRRFLREGLRLIDVDDMRIVRGSTDKAYYVALSYVWGQDVMKTKMPLSLKSSVRIDNDGVETIDLPDLLPRTIQDAIEVTRSVGYRYLWVDSLCIIQDDAVDRDGQLNMMDEIYSNANLTIAAASGLHADWGLPGISRPRHYTQRSETVINGVELALAFPSFRDLNSSMTLNWNTRGWTLQEKLLSKRILLFTDFQMYFRCANSICAEDIAMEAGILSDSIKKRQNPFKWGVQRERPSTLDKVGDFITLDALKLTDKSWNLTFLPNYVALIEEFSQRTFTYKQDTLKAILGVLRTWGPSNDNFPGGLPRDWLSDVLLWQPRDGSEYHSGHASRIGIPTWSWAAWSLSEGCIWPEYTKGVACRDQPITIHTEDNGSIYSYNIEPQYKEPWRVAKRSSELLSVTAQQHLKGSGTLLSFQSPVCLCKVGEVIKKRKDVSADALQMFYILDGINQRVGIVWTSERVAQMPRGHEFIALSYRTSGTTLKNAVDKKYIPKRKITQAAKVDPVSGTSYLQPDKEVDRSAGDWKVINVMLVEWKDDVAFRVAIGQIISTAWGTLGEQLVYLG
ncbi:HET-domain-containing protein [Mollisia scopiformis]|uniref:HET-domain-containing protein n=1 Tax=Mollisia scopiformis TaxID=149040 RepID=A0A194XIY0_MOLSC|nr:HET-domain-containing protein [Mollisia scopiformis]KUJ19722.1 HET-domain-containing protein [Mollisia scopiformis]